MTKQIIETNSMLDKYVTRVNQAIETHIDLLGPDSPIRKASVYALSSGGKRIRPSIALMVADSLGKKGDATMSALSIESFHTASLVADDMPAMDDDEKRRNLPSVHKKFGEATALLVSYALIGAGYSMIAQNGRILLDNQVSFADTVDLRCRLALENAAFNTGLNGATGGQFLDIYPPNLSLETIKKVIHLKTSSLFETSFVYGWLFGGGDIERLSDVKKAAAHYGLAFQIADDLGDQEQDKQNLRAVNLANVLGRDQAVQMFHEEINSFLLVISRLKLPLPVFKALADSLVSTVCDSDVNSSFQNVCKTELISSLH